MAVSHEQQAGFIGWWRPNPETRWRAVVQAATEPECWRKILDYAGAGQKLLLPSGQQPAPPYRRRKIKRRVGKVAR